MTQDIALLVGGWSAERDVSLTKGRDVEAALCEAGYGVRVVDVKRDLNALMDALSFGPYCVFNNLHGPWGEDGRIQSVLDILDVPYTHSGVMASAMAMDKPMAKRVAKTVDIKVPDGRVVSAEDLAAGDVLPRPFVVKPVAEGSSVGVRIVEEGENFAPLRDEGWSYGDQVLVEAFVPGRELTVAVLDGTPQAVTEIVSQTRFFDYEAKYADTRTTYVLPAEIDSAVYDRAMAHAARIYETLGCRGLARVDFRWDDKQGENGLYFLEINTQPGLTPGSIGPAQATYNGYSFPGLCAHLIESAVAQWHNAHNKNNDQTQADPEQDSAKAS